MSARIQRSIGAAFFSALALSACRSAQPAAATATASESPAPQPAGYDVAAVVHARQDSMLHTYTQADVDFMSGMISHHAQAIDMASMAASHGASAQVQTLAGRIINAQKDEIYIMQHWLSDRGLPVPAAKAAPMKMMMDGMEHDMWMPGMLTPAQMAQLDSARGKDFDRLFLEGMIQHHRGAITMVHQLIDNFGAERDELVFKIASDVNVDQTTEIARMQKLLASIVLGVDVQQ